MNQYSIETIQNLIKSEQWKILKRDILLPFIEKTDSVSNIIKIGDNQLDGADAYNAKFYTVKKLKGLIKYIDNLKNVNSNSASKIESYK